MCRRFDCVKSYNFCTKTRQKMELRTPCETDVLYRKIPLNVIIVIKCNFIYDLLL